MRQLGITIAIMTTVGITASTLEAIPAPEETITEQFQVSYVPGPLDKGIISWARAPETPGTIALNCKVEIQDPNRILGTPIYGVVTEITDADGHTITMNAPPQRSKIFTNCYQELQYHAQVIQPKIPKWRSKLRNSLHLPFPSSAMPRTVYVRQPSPLQLPLDTMALKQEAGALRRVKGYFHALVVDSFRYVDLPFEPNDNWVRLTDEHKIRITDASCDGHAYEVRIDGQFDNSHGGPILCPGEPLPDQFPAEIRVLDPNDEPIIRARGRGSPIFVRVRGRYRYRGRTVTTSGSHGTTSTRMRIAPEKVRFVIAVHPRHEKIPFELEHIPLPDLNEAGP